MQTWKRISLILALAVALAPLWAGGAPSDPQPLASLLVGPYGIDWLPKVSAGSFTLRVAGPTGVFLAKTFPGGKTPRFEVSDLAGSCPDGIYTWELRASPQGAPAVRGDETGVPPAGAPEALSQSGHFRVLGGSILVPAAKEPRLAGPLDVVHADDVIVTGSLCIGYDCATDGSEDFGFDTIKMKENNLQIFFDDTSTTAGFPANDWRLIANDSASGGGNYFSIADATNSRVPFKIEAGAPTSALYVDDSGRVGLGTATPVLDLHILSGNTPSIRLDQDTTSGWTAQVWDIAANESNFFLRDTTGGSKLPFRIQPGAPTNTLTMKSTGYVGIGTWSPESHLEIEATGANVVLAVQRTDGATMKLSAMGSSGQIGTVTEHALNFMTNNVKRLSVGASTGNVGIGVTSPTYPLHMASGAYCSAGGAWTNASSIAFKQNVQALGLADARRALADLRPVSFAYKADPGEEHLGFIAEEVPELVATGDRQGLSPMDIVAVLTRVVQEQQKTIAELRERVEQLEKR